MKRLTVILLAAFLTSCTENESLEDFIQQENIVTFESYKTQIIGIWIDNEQEENIKFEQQQVYFMQPTDTIGGFDYFVTGDQLTVKYGTYTEITKQINIENNVLSFGDKTYKRK